MYQTSVLNLRWKEGLKGILGVSAPEFPSKSKHRSRSQAYFRPWLPSTWLAARTRKYLSEDFDRQPIQPTMVGVVAVPI